MAVMRARASSSSSAAGACSELSSASGVPARLPGVYADAGGGFQARDARRVLVPLGEPVSPALGLLRAEGVERSAPSRRRRPTDRSRARSRRARGSGT